MKKAKIYTILSIETSCDESALSVVQMSGNASNFTFKVLSNVVVSQIEIHQEYGGVFPAIAKREHEKALPILLEKVLKESKIKKPDFIAVTYGPGLEPALWVGINFARAYADIWQVPLVPVNHMEGHLLSSYISNTENRKIELNKNLKINRIKFPILSLLVSGGHTELVVAKKIGLYKKIGQTLDDAVGEAFDKVARMIGLPYPGGPEIAKLAQNHHPLPPPQQGRGGIQEIHFPRPMMHSKNYNFSYSGLKTSVLYTIRDLKIKNPKILEDKNSNEIKSQIAHEFQNSAIEVLVHKTMRAIMEYKIKTLLVGGGVANNKYLQNELTKSCKKHNENIILHFPQKDFSTDNSLMIALAGYFNFLKNKKGVDLNKIKADGNLSL